MKLIDPNAYATDAEAKESKDKYLFNCAQRSVRLKFLSAVVHCYKLTLCSTPISWNTSLPFWQVY